MYLLTLLVLTYLTYVASQTATFTSQTSNQFAGRTYPLCAANSATASSSSFFVIGGYTLNITAASPSGANGIYQNDVQLSTDYGKSWTQQIANGAPNSFQPSGWTAAIYLANGTLALLGTGQDSTQYNTVYTSTNNGQSWGIAYTAPFQARENFGSNIIPGTNIAVVALGGTSGLFVDDIWYTYDATNWQPSCGNSTTLGINVPTCPLVVSATTGNAAEVHGPALVGFYGGSTASSTWVLIGGYDSNTTGSTYTVSNQVAVSIGAVPFAQYFTYTAPFSPRAQTRVTIDDSNNVYLYGGVYDIRPLSNYIYNNDLWYSTNAASTSATWTQLSTSGLPLATYGSSSVFTSSSLFNGCLFYRAINGQRSLIYAGGLYAYYLQNNTAPVYLQASQLITTSLNATSQKNAASATSTSFIVVALVIAAVIALFL